MQLTVDINTKKLTDATGMVALAAVDKPQLFYGTRETLEFTFLNDGEPVNFTDTDTFSVALDNNFIHTDSLMASSADAMVIDARKGRVDILLDMRAGSFNEKLNGKESVGAYLEVTVLHSGSTVPEMLLQDRITARGRVQTVEGAPESADPEYYTSAQIRALLNAGYEMEFSAGGESWHAGQADGDLYYHYRNRKIGGEWSDKIMIPKGEKGDKGDKGDTGDKGDKGDTGDKGDPGKDGAPGRDGVDGKDGAPGKDDTGEKGEKGDKGDRGEAFKIDATGTFAERSAYDAGLKNFVYLATDTGNIYIKNSDTPGDWSDPIAFKGEKGDIGSQGEQGPQGEKGDKGDRGEAGADGLTPEIDPDTKHWMIGGSDTGVVAEAKLEGGTAEITEVADNIATLSGTNVPVGVRTNSGTYYPIEKGSVVIDITNGQIKLDVTPYLAYDNAASFTGPWTVYYAAGSKGDKGDNALSFQIGTVTTLAAGASATAEAAISDEGLVTLNLGIPQGANGADGQDGSDGEDADATAAIDAHNSDASAHTAIQNKFASYLPLAGGTMTGVINRNGALVQNTVSGGSVSLIASHTGATEKGAALYLWDEANSTYPGYFILRAGHTSGYSDLRGTAPGGLTWRGASLIGECSKTMNGYTKLPNGIIIQWGSTSSTASSVSATFPVAFTAAPIVIPHSPSDGVGIAVSATTTSATFTISSGSINVRYIAIGY